MTNEEMKAKLEALQAENAALKAKKIRPLSMKVSPKGGLSVYGLGRFPVTLYRQQWDRLLGYADQINAFIAENEGELKTKE